MFNTEDLCFIDRVYEVTGNANITFDINDISLGCVFAASVGSVDREKMIPEAISKGARCILIKSYKDSIDKIKDVYFIYTNDIVKIVALLLKKTFNNPTENISLNAVLGTNGKTSVCWFMAQLFNKAMDKKVAVIGTNGFGSINDIQPSSMTTPDINNIYKIFSYLEKNNFDSIAMEVSAHAITQSRVYGLEFDTAILTNITQDHLDYYKTFNEYALAKERLFSEYKIGTSIINLDNAFSRNVYYRIRGEKIGYSIFHPTDIYVKEYRLHEKGIYALLDSSWGKLHLNFSLFGDYNLANLLPAIAILLRKNISISKIEECISSITLPKGRMESIFFDNGLRVIVDFAHSPDALQTLLSSLRKHFNKNIGIVFGCGGNRDKIKRGAMWRIATELADKVWITSDNPRFEKFEDIVADMVSQPSLDFESKEKNYCTEEDRKNAIKQAMMYANSKENFTLVIAGKGHEKYQDIQGVKLDFSDIETIKEVGSSMGLKYV